MSLSVVPHAAEPTKHGVPRVAVTATGRGIKSSAYPYPESHIERSILRRVDERSVIRKWTRRYCQNQEKYLFVGRRLRFAGRFLI
jgi:hypothetical protein